MISRYNCNMIAQVQSLNSFNMDEIPASNGNIPDNLKAGGAKIFEIGNSYHLTIGVINIISCHVWSTHL